MLCDELESERDSQMWSRYFDWLYVLMGEAFASIQQPISSSCRKYPWPDEAFAKLA
jgi:hypothetical protein